jgi:hypothetical protein
MTHLGSIIFRAIIGCVYYDRFGSCVGSLVND